MSTSQWAGQELPAMWASAQAADTLMAWQQVNAWQRTFDLLLHHERQLRACRHELIAAWPPERSPAAQSFVEYLDSLLISIGHAQEDALANRRGLFGVLSSLASTKADMAKMKAKWDEYEAEERALSKNLSNVLPSSATHDWRRALSELARERMTRNDQEVLEASRQMIVPTTWGPSDDHGTPFPNNSTSGPSAEMTRDGGLGGSGGEGWMHSPTISSVLGHGDGPDLAGASVLPGSSSLAPGIGSAHGQATSPGGIAGSPSLVPVDRPPFENTHGTARSHAVGSRAADGSRTVGVSHSGVVGGHPSRGSQPLGQVIAGPGPVARRANPVGGVIGDPRPSAPMGGLLAGAGRGSERRRQRPERDPYNIWAIDEGVPPVIEPAHEQPHTPGPGVIGIDR